MDNIFEVFINSVNISCVSNVVYYYYVSHWSDQKNIQSYCISVWFLFLAPHLGWALGAGIPSNFRDLIDLLSWRHIHLKSVKQQKDTGMSWRLDLKEANCPQNKRVKIEHRIQNSSQKSLGKKIIFGKGKSKV